MNDLATSNGIGDQLTNIVRRGNKLQCGIYGQMGASIGIKVLRIFSSQTLIPIGLCPLNRAIRLQPRHELAGRQARLDAIQVMANQYSQMDASPRQGDNFGLRRVYSCRDGPQFRRRD